MKSSRAILLTAILFVAPVFAEDTVNPPAPVVTEQNASTTAPAQETKTSLLAKAAFPFVFVATQATNATDFVAGWTVNPVLNKITSISCLNKLQSHVPTVGRVIVATAALYGFYLAHEAYKAQDVDSNDDTIFDDVEDNN